MRWIIIRVKQFQGPEPQKEVPIMDRFNSQWSVLQSDNGDPSLNDDASSRNDDACYAGFLTKDFLTKTATALPSSRMIGLAAFPRNLSAMAAQSSALRINREALPVLA
jgi:hypothetical protein